MKWIDAVDEARAEGFDELGAPGDLPAGARADSLYWSRAFFAQGAGPYEPSQRVRRAIHRATARTPDLVEHEYEARGLHLTVTEGRSFMLVVIAKDSLDILALPEHLRTGAVARAAAALFHADCLDGRCFLVPETTSEGVFFSTNPDADPRLLGAWRDRIDGGIRGGELFFLLYKRLAWMTGWLNGSEWLGPGQAVEPVRSGRPRRRRR
jgi:hypothetical protein